MAIKRVIIDVDAGTDDYLALLLLLNADKKKEICIEAIVCSMGNTAVDNVCNNVVRLLEIVHRTDIAVYRGVPKQLIPPNHDVAYFHGVDGFGDLKYDRNPDLSVISSIPAPVAIGNLILQNPNEISVICVGPLTNLALSIRLFDRFADSIKDLWIMGGNYTALGNATETAEYNFYIDPEAVHIVLDTIKKPIYILTWETCIGSKIPVDWRYGIFGKKTNPEIELLNKAEISIYGDREDYWLPCDSFVVAAYLNNEIVTQKSSFHASIELHGAKTRGQMVLDHLKNKTENVTIIQRINNELFKEMLLQL